MEGIFIGNEFQGAVNMNSKFKTENLAQSFKNDWQIDIYTFIRKENL